MKEIAKLNITAVDGQVSTFLVDQEAAKNVQNQFRTLVRTSKNGTLDFSHFIFGQDNTSTNPDAEETLCVPASDVSRLGVVRPMKSMKMSVNKKRDGRGKVSWNPVSGSGGALGNMKRMAMTDHRLLDRGVPAKSLSRDLAHQFDITEPTALGYVYNIRSMHERGELA